MKNIIIFVLLVALGLCVLFIMKGASDDPQGASRLETDSLSAERQDDTNSATTDVTKNSDDDTNIQTSPETEVVTTNSWATFYHTRDGYSFRYPLGDVPTPVVASAGSGSDFAGQQESVRMGDFAPFATIEIAEGTMNQHINAYFSAYLDQRIQKVSETVLDTSDLLVKKVEWKDVKAPQAGIGVTYYVQLDTGTTLIVGGVGDEQDNLVREQIVTSIKKY